MSTKNLNEAKKEKFAEFYTQYDDIQKEVNAYIDYDKNVFRGKTVFCPCDDPEWSNFTKFFAQNFEQFGLKKLISTSYAYASKKISIPWQPTLFETENPNYDEKKSPSRGKIFTLTDRDPPPRDVDHLSWHYLEGDGDFRSDEVKTLRDEADIICTNPPFSLFREFLAWIVEADKKFLVIGNLNAATYKETFPLIKGNKIWFGATCFKGGAAYFIGDPKFYEPQKMSNQKHAFLKDNVFYWRVNGVRWYTNLEHSRRHEPLILMSHHDNLKYDAALAKTLKEKYGVSDYPKYDNYDALEVPFCDAIPADYDGVMGVPISFFDKYCPEQFEIIGATESEGKGFSAGLFIGGEAQATVNGVKAYKRLFIKAKNNRGEK